jgi:hypothetical protein
VNYWLECIEASFEENGIVATKEQIASVAADVAGGHENYSMAYPVPESPHKGEVELLRKELERERRKVGCPTCGGRGRITTHGPYHSSNSSCYECRGAGKIDG